MSCARHAAFYRNDIVSRIVFKYFYIRVSVLPAFTDVSTVFHLKPCYDLRAIGFYDPFCLIRHF